VPSHCPVWPQVDDACIVHWAPGSVPAMTGPHAPSAPAPFRAAEQAWQRPVQAVLQQTSSTQKPVAQSLPSVQGPPLPAGITHAPPLHTYPEAQLAEVEQDVTQAPAAHA
jgi:hypothetical protein